MKTADLISSYLGNEMTPEQERQFLLSVAASDTLRLALKSHFMLDRIVSDHAQRAHVPEVLRTSIFAHATAALAGVEPPEAPRAHEPEPARSAGHSRFNRMLGRGGAVALLLLAGFGTGYFVHSEVVSDVANVPTAVKTVPSVPVQQLEPSSPAVHDQPSTAAVTGTPPALTVDAPNAGSIDEQHLASSRHAALGHAVPTHSTAAAVPTTAQPHAGTAASQPSVPPASTTKPATDQPGSVDGTDASVKVVVHRSGPVGNSNPEGDHTTP